MSISENDPYKGTSPQLETLGLSKQSKSSEKLAKKTEETDESQPKSQGLTSSHLEKMSTSQMQQDIRSHQVQEYSHLGYQRAQRPIMSNKMTQRARKAFIGKYDKTPFKKAITVLVNCLQHVSQKTFESRFKETLQDFKKLGLKNYVAAVDTFKSNKWMTDLAQEFLSTEITRIPLALPNPEKFNHDVVLFDDGVYSGEQMERILRGMIGALEHRKNQYLHKIRFVVATPYMTTKGEAVLRELGKEKKVKLIILKHQKIPTVEEAVKEAMKGEDHQEIAKVIKLLNNLYWRTEFPSKTHTQKKGGGSLLQKLRAQRLKPEKPVKHAQGASSRGTMYFDHKVPDEFSFPKALAEGRVVNTFGKDERVELIPQTIPPYKKEFVITQTSKEVIK